MTTTCFGSHVAIVRLYTLKYILSTICKYLGVEISYTLTLVVTDSDSVMLCLRLLFTLISTLQFIHNGDVAT